MIYTSARGLASAFVIPRWGEAAEQDLPDWLVTLMSREVITLNTFGGLSYQGQAALPGDAVVLHESGRIEFCTASEFSHTYTLLEDRHAA